MKVVFFGTPEYVLPILKALYKEYNSGREQDLIAVVTQSPKEVGRKKFIERSPVDNWAYKHKIKVIHDLDNVPQTDLGIVAAYGKIIPQSTISKFSSGILNVHPSALPKYRGASPIQSAILNGEGKIGVSVIKMDKEMDHGPIVSQFREEIGQDETNEEVRTKVFVRAAKFLIAMIPSYMSGEIRLKEQDHASATFTNILGRDDGFVGLAALNDAMKGKNSKKIYDLYRAMQPWPGAWSRIKVNNIEQRIKILKMHMADDRKIVLDEVQLESRNPVAWGEFKSAYPESELGA